MPYPGAGQVHQTIPAQLPTTPGRGVELGSNVSTGLGLELTGHAARVLPPPRHASLFAARFHLLRPADVARLLGSAGGQSPCLGPAMTRPRAVPPPAPPWPPPTPTWPSPGAASLLLPWPPLRAASPLLRTCTCSGCPSTRLATGGSPATHRPGRTSFLASHQHHGGPRFHHGSRQQARGGRHLSVRSHLG